MIIKRFDLDDMKDILSASDFYKVLGYDGEAFKDEATFGKKASYVNIFIHPETYDAIRTIISNNAAIENSQSIRAEMTSKFDWFNFAPVSNGPRYDEVEEKIGRIIRNAIYILQPGDDLFEEQIGGEDG